MPGKKRALRRFAPREIACATAARRSGADVGTGTIKTRQAVEIAQFFFSRSGVAGDFGTAVFRRIADDCFEALSMRMPVVRRNLLVGVAMRKSQVNGELLRRKFVVPMCADGGGLSEGRAQEHGYECANGVQHSPSIPEGTERAKGFEPSTTALGTLHSTN